MGTRKYFENDEGYATYLTAEKEVSIDHFITKEGEMVEKITWLNIFNMLFGKGGEDDEL